MRTAAFVGTCATAATIVGCDCCCTYLWGGAAAAAAAALGLFTLPF